MTVLETHQSSLARRARAEIKIGIQVNVPIDYAAFGGQGQGGDDQRTSQAVVDYLNGRGGLAGRKIVPLYHRTDTNNGTFAAQAEAACVEFAEDKKVFAAISTTNAGDSPECYHKHGLPYLSHKDGVYDADSLRDLAGTLYVPGKMGSSRWAAAFVDGLAEQGYFAGGAKIGLIRYEREDFDRMVNRVFKPRLAAMGVTLTDEFIVSPPGSTAALGDTAAQTSSAILRFRSRGVDHVIFLEMGGAIPFFFMPQAEGQAYRPTYGLVSASLPQFQKKNVPEAQLTGTVGVGWNLSDDVGFQEDPGGNPAASLCAELFSKAGISITDRTNFGNALGYCDALLFLKAALDKTTNLTRVGLRAAVEGLGDAYNSPLTFATRFGPGRYDGAASVRNLAFIESCRCFKYTSPPRAVP